MKLAFFLDNIHGEVLNIETNPAFLATADDLNAKKDIVPFIVIGGQKMAKK